MTRAVRDWTGGVYDIGYRVVWCPKAPRLVVADPVAARGEGPIRAKDRGRGWPIATLEIVPDHVHLLVKANWSDSPSRIANQFKGFTSRQREHRRWYVIVITQTEAERLPATGRAAGVDVGVARFLTTSDEEVIANPWFLAASAETIARLQRRTEHAQRGSGNRKRHGRALAKEWRKVRNRRRDFHHKTARALVDNYDVIALEKLNTAGMTRRPAPKPDPGKAGAFLPNRAAAKAGLSKAILDAGWAQFANILTAKAESAGRRVVFVNPAHTSIECHLCGRECTRPRQDTVICPMHGTIDADINGARNIAARAGLGSGQAPAA